MSFSGLNYSFIHSGYFYSASSSPLLLRGAPDYSIDTVLELTRWSATGIYELKDLPKAPMWRLTWNLSLRPSGRKAPNLPLSHHAPHIWW